DGCCHAIRYGHARWRVHCEYLRVQLIAGQIEIRWNTDRVLCRASVRNRQEEDLVRNKLLASGPPKRAEVNGQVVGRRSRILCVALAVDKDRDRDICRQTCDFDGRVHAKSWLTTGDASQVR